MNEPLIQRPDHNAAKAFQDMADRIKHNANQAFGGAFVIFPPISGGAPFETLILDGNQDPAQFFTLLKVKCDVAIGLLEDQKRNQNQSFGRR